MKRYLNYLKYLLRHKWYVLVECWKKGLLYRGVFHDMSKFYPSELIPYAKFFYNSDGSPRQIRDKTGYYKPTDTGDKAFDFAWLLHQKRNRHHWQFWILPEDNGGTKILEIPIRDIMEMVCDWRGAGKAQGNFNDDATINWYEKNKEKMTIHPDSRKIIELFIQNL